MQRDFPELIYKNPLAYRIMRLLFFQYLLIFFIVGGFNMVRENNLFGYFVISLGFVLSMLLIFSTLIPYKIIGLKEGLQVKTFLRARLFNWKEIQSVEVATYRNNPRWSHTNVYLHLIDSKKASNKQTQEIKILRTWSPRKSEIVSHKIENLMNQFR